MPQRSTWLMRAVGRSPWGSSTSRSSSNSNEVEWERYGESTPPAPGGTWAGPRRAAGRPRATQSPARPRARPAAPARADSCGRLDEMSAGVVILTNDGALANRLAHPRYGVEKVYRVVVAGSPSQEVLAKLTEGVWLAEGKVRAKRVRVTGTRG